MRHNAKKMPQSQDSFSDQYTMWVFPDTTTKGSGPNVLLLYLCSLSMSPRYKRLFSSQQFYG